MGPRSVDRGNDLLRLSDCRSTLKLQWGRDQLIAEMNAGQVCSWNYDTLQWGRDQLIAEILPHLILKNTTVQLQWGRDQLIAEINRASHLRPVFIRFNGAAIS